MYATKNSSFGLNTQVQAQSMPTLEEAQNNYNNSGPGNHYIVIQQGTEFDSFIVSSPLATLKAPLMLHDWDSLASTAIATSPISHYPLPSRPRLCRAPSTRGCVTISIRVGDARWAGWIGRSRVRSAVVTITGRLIGETASRSSRSSTPIGSARHIPIDGCSGCMRVAPPDSRKVTAISRRGCGYLDGMNPRPTFWVWYMGGYQMKAIVNGRWWWTTRTM
jgi:hypothetical protein